MPLNFSKSLLLNKNENSRRLFRFCDPRGNGSIPNEIGWRSSRILHQSYADGELCSQADEDYRTCAGHSEEPRREEEDHGNH